MGSEETFSFALGRLIGAGLSGALFGLIIWGLRALVVRLRSTPSRVTTLVRVGSSLAIGYGIALVGAARFAALELLLVLTCFIASLVWWITARRSSAMPDGAVPGTTPGEHPGLSG